MRVVTVILFVAGAFPLWQAWRSNRRTSLLQAVHWAVAAWLAWTALAVLALTADASARLDLLRYAALSLTGCAGVAVLGARRPAVSAWNFVVLALLAIMLLPLAENLLPGAPLLDNLRLLFLVMTLAIGVLNYLPTRLAGAAALVLLSCAGEIWSLAEPAGPLAYWGGPGSFAWLLLGLAPWAGYLMWRWRSVPASEFDRTWLDFRDRYGLFWGQRVRDQFNNAAHHAGWPAHLFWQGLLLRHTIPPPGREAQGEMLATLRALLKRFV